MTTDTTPRGDAQDKTTAPEAQETTPMAETPAPTRATSTPPPALDPWLARMDRVVDLVAIGALTALCLRHQLGGEITAGAIVAVAGVQTGLRQISAARGGPGVGAVGALMLAVGLGAAVHAPAVADAASTLGQRGHAHQHLLLALSGVTLVALVALHPVALAVLLVGVVLAVGVQRIRSNGHQPRTTERGHARGGVLALLVVVALVVLGATSQGCRTAREVVMRASPGVPDVSGCTAGAQRCNGLVPEVCSSSGRWWSALPPRPDGTPRACGACVVEDGIAGCSL